MKKRRAGVGVERQQQLVRHRRCRRALQVAATRRQPLPLPLLGFVLKKTEAMATTAVAALGSAVAVAHVDQPFCAVDRNENAGMNMKSTISV